MKIIIGGAGRIGTYVTEVLCKEGHAITVVDVDEERLQSIARTYDVATKKGSLSSVAILEELFLDKQDIFIALSDIDEVNLVACQIAKKLGLVRCFCRIRHAAYLRPSIDGGQIFNIDHFIVPELLVAEQIMRSLSITAAFTKSFFFGAAELRVLEIPVDWKLTGVSLFELRRFNLPVVIGAIVREKRVIFPHGSDHLLPGDTVIVVAQTNSFPQILHFFDLAELPLKRVLLYGGGQATIEVVRRLEGHCPTVSVAEASYGRCQQIARLLPHAQVLHHTGSDWEFLREQHIDEVDAFIALSSLEEKNTLLALMAKEQGCPRVIACINDEAEQKLADRLGISVVISEKDASRAELLSLLHADTVRSTTALFGGQVEIFEVQVSATSPLIGIPLSILGPQLPNEMLLALIYGRGRLMIASGNHILSPGDQVVIVTAPQHRLFMESLLR